MRIEFVEDGGVDCPLLLVYGQDREGLSALVGVLHSLAAGALSDASLHDLPSFTPVGGCQLSLLTGTRNQEGLHRLGRGPTFRWIRDPEGWLEAAEFAEPFLVPSERAGVRYQDLEDHGDLRLILSTDRSW